MTEEYKISTTVAMKDKSAFKIFCIEKDLREGNTLRSLLVWFKELSNLNKVKFFKQYGIANKYTRKDKKKTLHVYFQTQKELDDINDMLIDFQATMKQHEVRVKMSYTKLLVSLVSWFQNLSPRSLKAFKEKYYLSGVQNSIKAIEDRSSESEGTKININGKASHVLIPTEVGV